ncbi:MAG: glycerol-3-phosphate O-acyltransferase [Chlamydiales bacterium]|jgi:glycerol-3-phosphate O-acyltransferase
MEFLLELKKCEEQGEIPGKCLCILKDMYKSYQHTYESNGMSLELLEGMYSTLLGLVKVQVSNPFVFEPFHQRKTEPFDYYGFGLDFIRPLVDLDKSAVRGIQNVDRMVKQIQSGDNVILLANHQTEPDPQIISILLEETHSSFAADMIFVAGDRVTTDPLASTFSIGRNLLCIYSKKHIDDVPKLKEEKQRHNKRTMQLMSELLSEGGKCIFVAPSGGRDRLNPQGVLEVASFDPQSIEMFSLMTQRAKSNSHFYPLTLATYPIAPPPQSIEREVGERRSLERKGAVISFLDEVELSSIPNSDSKDKRLNRLRRADYIWSLVNEEHKNLIA